MSCDAVESRRNVVRPLNVASGEGVNRNEPDKEAGSFLGEEFGERTTKRMSDPCKPSRDEIKRHNLTHQPYRNWCRHCVMGRGKESPHLQSKSGEGEVPEFSFDFCFPGEETPGENLIVLCGRMRRTRMTLSTMVPRKSTGEFVTARIMAFLRECGCEMSKIIVKTDQEEAMLAMVGNLVRHRATMGAEETIPENSVAYSSQSNGVIERGVQDVEGQTRTFRSALEENIGEKLEITDSIWP